MGFASKQRRRRVQIVGSCDLHDLKPASITSEYSAPPLADCRPRLSTEYQGTSETDDVSAGPLSAAYHHHCTRSRRKSQDCCAKIRIPLWPLRVGPQSALRSPTVCQSASAR